MSETYPFLLLLLVSLGVSALRRSYRFWLTKNVAKDYPKLTTGFVMQGLDPTSQLLSSRNPIDSQAALRSVERAEEFLISFSILAAGLFWVPYLLSKELGFGLIFFPFLTWLSLIASSSRLRVANPSRRLGLAEKEGYPK